jgi:hypothetical protein
MKESTGFYAIANIWIVGALLASCAKVSFFMGFMGLIWFVYAYATDRREKKNSDLLG